MCRDARGAETVVGDWGVPEVSLDFLISAIGILGKREPESGRLRSAQDNLSRNGWFLQGNALALHSVGLQIASRLRALAYDSGWCNLPAHFSNIEQSKATSVIRLRPRCRWEEILPLKGTRVLP